MPIGPKGPAGPGSSGGNPYIPDNFDDILKSQIQFESSGRPNAVSPKGAIGLAQIMPATAQRYGYQPHDMYDPTKNTDVQRRYMTDLLNKHQGDVAKSLAEYNSGRVQNLPRETLSYVRNVMGAVKSRSGPGTAYAGEAPPTQAPPTAGPSLTDPLNYHTKADWLARVQELPRYLKNKDPIYRDEYLKNASQYYDNAWTKKRVGDPRPQTQPFRAEGLPPTAVEPIPTGPGIRFGRTDPNAPAIHMRITKTPEEMRGGPGLQDRLRDPKTREQWMSAEYKGIPLFGGADYPKGTGPAAYGGGPDPRGIYGRYVDRPFEQAIGKPLHRVAEAGLASIFGGQTAGYRAWNNPGEYPTFRKYSSGYPFMNIEEPESMALMAAVAFMPQIAAATGFGGLWEASEGPQMARAVLQKAVGRVGFSGAVGAGIYSGRAITAGDPGQAAGGAIAAGGGQALTELPGAAKQIGGMFGLGQSGQKQGLLKNIAQSISEYLPGLKPVLKGEKDFNRVFSPRETGPGGEPMSLAQKQTREELASVTRRVKNAIGNRTFDIEISPRESTELYGRQGEPPGVAVPGRGAGAGAGGGPIREFESYRPKPGEATPAGERVIPAEKKKVYVPGKKGRFGKMEEKETLPAMKLKQAAGKPYVPQAARPPMQRVTFDQVDDVLYDARQIGWDFHGRMNYSKSGAPVIMRQLTRNVTRVVADDIEAASPGLGREWEQAIFRNDTANILTKLFSEDGVMAGNEVGIPELQEAITDISDKGYFHDFIGNFGSHDGERMLRVFKNGADPLASPSVRGKWNPYYRLNPLDWIRGGRLHLPIGIHPQLPYFAGPATDSQAVWRGAFGALMRLGAAGTMRMLMEMSGADEPYEPPTPVLQRQVE